MRKKRSPMLPRADLPEELIAAGLSREEWDTLQDGSPNFASAFRRMAAVPIERGALDPKTRALIGIAVNASTTHLFEPALRQHCHAAFEAGATREEIVETLELACALGIHTALVGMPILKEELALQGEHTDASVLDERQLKIKQDFQKGRQSWTSLLDDFLLLDPEWLSAYVDYSTVPWKRGAIEPRIKELIYIAIDAQTSHLYAPGTRFHIRNALAQGATGDQILEVLELVSLIGIHTMVVALPILADELRHAVE